MTAHPIDTEALRAELEAAVVDYRSPNLDLAARALSALTAAEHRATRAEAQSAIRGRAVVMYRERARQAEAERDWNLRSSRLAKEERIKANARAERAEAERDEWRQTALDERAAALDALEQIKAREARIKAVRDVLDAADDRGPIGLTFDGTPFPAFVSSADIRRALDT